MLKRGFKHFYWKEKELFSIAGEFGDNCRSFGVSFRFFGEDNTVSVMIHAVSFYLYAGIDIRKISNIVKSHEHGRRVGLYTTGRHLTFDFFSGGTTSLFFVDMWRLITGHPEYSKEKVVEGFKDVVLPEGRYPSKYTIEKQTWRFPRWFIAKTRHLMTIEIEERGIPVPGKGTEIWNSQDEAISSTYSGVDYESDKFSIHRAYDDFALTVLAKRQKYGSIDWLPDDSS